MDIKKLVEDAHNNATKKGFWEDWDLVLNLRSEMKLNCKEYKDLNNNLIGNRLMLITGEVAEAHEALRKDDNENLSEELADIVIRVADLAGGLNIDLESEILKKMEKNKNRPYKHGKNF